MLASSSIGERSRSTTASSTFVQRASGAATTVAMPAPATSGKRSSTQKSNAGVRDRDDWDAPKPSVMDYLRHAQAKSGRRPLELVREYLRLSRGAGKLSFAEYVQYGVYNTSRHSPADQSRFITNRLHWPITHACCDMTWQATTEDKWLCARILTGSGIPVPETVAVIDRTERTYPDTRKISTPEQFRDVLNSSGSLPLFGKENRGMCSWGAFLAIEADRNSILFKGRGRLSYDECFESLIGDTPYLLQRVVRNHHFFDRYTDAVATIRVCVLNGRDQVSIPFAILKLPARGNIADNFWRRGNVACKVDVQNGMVRTARLKDPLETIDYTDDPETGTQLVGETVPMWDRVLDLAHRCARIFDPVRYQSMDIAVTEEGPVLIEINTGGGFDLPQLATGEGFLTDEIRTFFKSHGYRKL